MFLRITRIYKEREIRYPLELGRGDMCAGWQGNSAAAGFAVGSPRSGTTVQRRQKRSCGTGIVLPLRRLRLLSWLVTRRPSKVPWEPYTYASWGVNDSDEVTGPDIDESSLAIARMRFPNRTYLHGAGERLPFEDESFDRVISAVPLPYVNIQKTLAEIHRILVPGGSVSLSLHLSSCTIDELLHKALPKPVPTPFRLYVMANGLWFHCTGKTVGFVIINRTTELFQTERGMRVALNRAGFVDPSFSRAPGPAGGMFIVEARTRKR
jgi:SAM-dependent methyltransferase